MTLREDAFAEAGRVSARVLALSEDADRVFLGVEGLLKSLTANRKLDARWVETFFPSAETPRKKPRTPVAPSPAPL